MDAVGKSTEAVGYWCIEDKGRARGKERERERERRTAREGEESETRLSDDSRAKNEEGFMGVKANRRGGMSLGFHVVKNREGGEWKERRRQNGR